MRVFSVRPCITTTVLSMWYIEGEAQSSSLLNEQGALAEDVFLALKNDPQHLETNFFSSAQLWNSYTLTFYTMLPLMFHTQILFSLLLVHAVPHAQDKEMSS